MTFATGDGHVIAHDLPLIAASPVLKAMLESPVMGAQTKRIAVKDASSEGVSLFLDILYTTATRSNPDHKTMLVALDVAHRWQVHSVVRMLTETLREMSTSDSSLAPKAPAGVAVVRHEFLILEM